MCQFISEYALLESTAISRIVTLLSTRIIHIKYGRLTASRSCKIGRINMKGLCQWAVEKRVILAIFHLSNFLDGLYSQLLQCKPYIFITFIKDNLSSTNFLSRVLWCSQACKSFLPCLIYCSSYLSLVDCFDIYTSFKPCMAVTEKQADPQTFLCPL